MSLLHMVDDLEKLRVHLKQDEIGILGHSDGASIALSYAYTHPAKVHKLLLLYLYVYDWDDSETWNRIADERRGDPKFSPSLKVFDDHGGPGLPLFKPRHGQDMADFATQAIPYYLYDPPRDSAGFLETFAHPPSSYAYVEKEMADSACGLDQSAGLSKVVAPTRIFHGRDDPICSVTTAERAHALIPGSRLIILDDCGHFPTV